MKNALTAMGVRLPVIMENDLLRAQIPQPQPRRVQIDEVDEKFKNTVLCTEDVFTAKVNLRNPQK
jgi:hypothetical protein